MSCAERWLPGIAAALVALFLAACGGNSSETTITITPVVADQPTGPNTTQIVVDSGPGGAFSLGTVNVPYVTVTLCSPGSATQCVTIDHVLLDTGSVGLRVLKSKVAALSLPPVMVPGAASGVAVECYLFTVGGLWGPLVSADLTIAGESASSLTVQLIDDGVPAAIAPPKDCVDASDGGLLTSVDSLAANGVLGVGNFKFDCGEYCNTGDYAAVGYTVYYACDAGVCTSATMSTDSQMQNPVVHFPIDNNGTLIVLPALPDLGAPLVYGRLAFGIGTQTNNQISPTVSTYYLDAVLASPTYSFQTTTLGSATYPYSYLDSGSNGMFFDDASIPLSSLSSASPNAGGWYGPSSPLRLTATFSDYKGNAGPINFSILSADTLFSTSGVAYADLAGSFPNDPINFPLGPSTFAWGLPFFYGRTVYTAIRGQSLAIDGAWNAF